MYILIITNNLYSVLFYLLSNNLTIVIVILYSIYVYV
jgi:hypothetical protein